MPRPRKQARLQLRTERRNGESVEVWIIRDGSHYERTGCLGSEYAEAERRLADYLAGKYETPTSRDPHVIAVADILNHYVLQHCPTIASGKQEVDFIKQLVPFWGSRMLYDVDAAGCRAYAASRLEAGVSSATARREIETLRAATRFYVTDRKVQFLPSFWLPEKGTPRERWMTRSEVAAFLHAARRRGNHHLARVILIGIYTGTRTGAILRMRWVPNTEGGWFDLEHGVMYRRGQAQRETTKRRPPIRIPSRLLPHLRRWKALDGICTHVIHRDGKPVHSVRRAWANSRTDAGLSPDIIPHTLRHTTATWGMQNGADVYQFAGFLGMSVKMLNDVYGHHHPDHQRSATDAVSRRPGRQL